MVYVFLMFYFCNILCELLRLWLLFFYDVVVYLIDKFLRLLGIFFMDDEIGLLVIYIGLYFEFVLNLNLVMVVVVCLCY